MMKVVNSSPDKSLQSYEFKLISKVGRSKMAELINIKEMSEVFQ